MRDIKFRAWRKCEMYEGLCIEKLLAIAAKVGFEDNAISPVIWMQYTGLKDKNGVEIYEGDIVHNSNFTDDCNHMVDMIEDLGQWFMVDINEGYAEPLCDWLDSSVVIGNIHQNPELLEDKK